MGWAKRRSGEVVWYPAAASGRGRLLWGSTIDALPAATDATAFSGALGSEWGAVALTCGVLPVLETAPELGRLEPAAALVVEGSLVVGVLGDDVPGEERPAP